MGHQPRSLQPGAAKPGEPPPVILTRSTLTSPFMTCTFSSVLPGGVSWRVEADCTDGKAKGHEFFGFAVLSELLHWSWDKQTVTFRRCPE